MNAPTDQPTLRDFLRPIRVQKWLLIAAVLVAVGASIAYSLSKSPTYTAQASLSFQDESRFLGLVGIAAVPTQTPDQLASASAQSLLQSRVVRAVKAALKSPLTGSDLSRRISVRVEPNSSLVAIDASQPTASGAQALANAFARVGADTANADARAVFAASAAQLRRGQPSKNDATARAIYGEQLGRLEALSRIASPAQVAVLARRPTAPTSPRPVRNALLGGMLGVIVGLLAVFVRDSFDRRLRSVRDIESELGLMLLGHVRDDALGHIPVPGNDRGVTSADWELFRILRRNLDFLGGEGEAPPTTIAVTSSLPQEGKTTVAAFLAFTSAAIGRRTLLIECDLRRPVLAERLGIEASPGLSDFVAGDATPADILQVVSFGDPASANGAGRNLADATSEPRFRHELVCITAGTRTQHPVEILRSDRFNAMFKEVQAAYEVVVLDTTPLLSVVDALELLPHVAAIVLCVRATKITRDQARAGKAALGRLPDRPVGLVVTGTQRTDEEYTYYGYY